MILMTQMNIQSLGTYIKQLILLKNTESLKF
jgi:hypothetical protein